MLIVKISTIIGIIASLVFVNQVVLKPDPEYKEEKEKGLLLRILGKVSDAACVLCTTILAAFIVTIVLLGVNAMFTMGVLLFTGVDEVTYTEQVSILEVNGSIYDTFVVDSGKYYTYYVEDADGYTEKIIPTTDTVITQGDSNYVVIETLKREFPVWTWISDEILSTKYTIYTNNSESQ